MPLARDNLHARCDAHEPARKSARRISGRARSPLIRLVATRSPNSVSASRHLHRGAYSLRSVHTTEGGGSLRHHHGVLLCSAWDLSRRLLWWSYGRRVCGVAHLLIYTWP